MTGPVLTLDDVTFGYGRRPVLEDVSLTVDAGDYVGVVGPNGSGKSTLLRIALGLLAPDAGSARLFGEPATSFDDGTRVGYVAQDSSEAAVKMPVTVAEVVRMGRFPHCGFGRLGAEDRERAREALETVDVGHLADRRISALSGGQRQRTYIARALAAEADLLVLDEPTVGVDAESVEAFFDLLGALNDDGLTVVLVEHDIGNVVEHASTVVCLDREVLYDGPAADFLETDALAAAYGTTTGALLGAR